MTHFLWGRRVLLGLAVALTTTAAAAEPMLTKAEIESRKE
jgi:hypothetical protein